MLTLGEVNALDRTGFVGRFGGLVEHSPWVAEKAWEGRPFASRADVLAAFRGAMQAADAKSRLEIIRAHPELAGRPAVEGALTPESTGEQASAGLDRLTPDEYERFNRLNRDYRTTFGFPLVVCVREHTKESILRGAEARLAHTPLQEQETALEEIAKIVALRLEDLVEREPRGEAGAHPAPDGDADPGGNRERDRGART